MTLEFAIDSMASYDDLGKIKKSAYVLEKGEYCFYAGTSVRDTVKLSYVYSVEEDTVTQQLTTKLTPKQLKRRLLADGTYEELPVCEPAPEENGLTPQTIAELEATLPVIRGVSQWPKRAVENRDYYFFDETFEYIKKSGIRFDMLSLDCTNVDIPVPDTGHHMGFPNINRVVERLRSLSAINEETVICVNHFSHNGNPLHEHLSERADEYGYLVSYDGFEVNI